MLSFRKASSFLVGKLRSLSQDTQGIKLKLCKVKLSKEAVASSIFRVFLKVFRGPLRDPLRGRFPSQRLSVLLPLSVLPLQLRGSVCAIRANNPKLRFATLIRVRFALELPNLQLNCNAVRRQATLVYQCRVPPHIFYGGKITGMIRKTAPDAICERGFVSGTPNPKGPKIEKIQPRLKFS